MKKLNEEQADIVAKNHNLIYSYAKKYSLNLDLFYDILSISLCKTALIYKPDKSKFSTLAYKIMDNDVRMEYRKSKALIRVDEPYVVSLDEQIFDGFTVYDVVDDKLNCEDEALAKIAIENFAKHLNEKELLILKLLSLEFKQNEIADRLQLSQGHISRKIKNLRLKLIAV